MICNKSPENKDVRYMLNLCESNNRSKIIVLVVVDISRSLADGLHCTEGAKGASVDVTRG